MLSDKRLIVAYKNGCEDDSYRDEEWHDADETILRREIKKAIELLELDTFIDDEVNTAYKKLYKNGFYELPECRFEFIEKD